MRLILILANAAILIVLAISNTTTHTKITYDQTRIFNAIEYLHQISEYLSKINISDDFEDICAYPAANYDVHDQEHHIKSRSKILQTCQFISHPTDHSAFIANKADFINFAYNDQRYIQESIPRRLLKINQHHRYQLWINSGLISCFLFISFLFIRQELKSRAIGALHLQLTNAQLHFAKTQEVMLSAMEDTRAEQHKALKLTKENHQLAEIVQKSEDAIIRLDKDLNILHANPTAIAYFNLDYMHSEPINFLKYLSSEVQNQIKTALSTLNQKTQSTKVNFLMPATENTAERNFYLTITSLEDDNCDSVEFAVIASDISILYEQQRVLKNIIEQAPNALIMCNSYGNIVMCNSQAAKLFDYTKDDLVGKPIEVLVPSNIKDAHPGHRQKFALNPQSRAMGMGRDLTAQKKNGEEFPVEIGLNPLRTVDGEFVIASIVDLSERIKIQRHLEKINRELESKNHEMEQFIYTISHDLKSPLVTINGFSKLLETSLRDKMDDKQAHQMARIQSNVIHMESLLNDLLELSRILKVEIDKEDVNVNEIIDDVLATLEVQIEQSQSTIICPDNLHLICANRRLLTQCIQNLIANAIKYRDESRPAVITINTQQIENAIHLTIEDNGLGIDEQYHEKIFRIFERLNIGEGTGIGLAIVKTAMAKHQGSILLESTPGKGSKFTLIFPCPIK